MRRLSLLASFVVVLMAVPALAKSPAPEKAADPVISAEKEPRIQLAILLDTSGSMDGLINQTREQIWKIVNTFATAKKNGKRPRLELALYEYGNDRLSRENGFITQHSGFTTNLDLVSEKLFALKTSGGDEFCGQVIDKVTRDLSWSQDKGDLKLIYIAGNESFSQGPVPYTESVKRAIGQGIVVNTIHAGDARTGINDHWEDGAKLADGNFIAIDQNQKVAYVAAPQDAEIARLGVELNKTYVGYGRQAPAAAARQMAQDKNAEGSSAGVATLRAVSKSSGFYDNSDWDLVDAKKKGKKLEAMPAAELPKEMAELKPEERNAFVEKKEKERAEIQSKIGALNAEREKFVAAEQKKAAAKPNAPKTLDSAVVESVKAQGVKAEWSF